MLLIPPHQMAAVAAWRPPLVQQRFSDAVQKDTLAWIGRLESSLADTANTLGAHQHAIDRLKKLIKSELPEFSAGPSIDMLINDIKRIGGSRDCADLCRVVGAFLSL